MLNSLSVWLYACCGLLCPAYPQHFAHGRPAAPSGDDSYVRPLFADRCQAGFPSPATDYAEQELDLNSYCISRPAATFFLRASGESMNQAGVQNGDLLVVDRAEKPQHGDIVIAEIEYVLYPCRCGLL